MLWRNSPIISLLLLTCGPVSAFSVVRTRDLAKEAIYIANSSKHNINNCTLAPHLQLTYSYSCLSRSGTKMEIQNLKGGIYNEPAFNTISLNLLRLNVGPKEQVYFGVLGVLIDEISPIINRKGVYLAYGLSRLSILDKFKFLNGSPVKFGFMLGFTCWSRRSLQLVTGQDPVSQGVLRDVKEYFRLPLDKKARSGETSFTYGLKLNVALSRFFSLDISYLNIMPSRAEEEAEARPETAGMVDRLKLQEGVTVDALEDPHDTAVVAGEDAITAHLRKKLALSQRREQAAKQETAAAKQEIAAAKHETAAAKKKYADTLATLFAWGKLLSLNLSFTLGG